MNFIGYYSEIVTQSGILHNTIINQEPSTHHKNIPSHDNESTANEPGFIKYYVLFHI